LTEASDFTRGLRVYDSLGTSQDIEFRFVKATAPSSNGTSAVTGAGVALDTVLTSLPNIDDSESITLEVGGRTASFAIDTTTTIQSIINTINNDVVIGDYVFAELNGNQLTIRANEVNEQLNITNGPGTIGTGAAEALGFSVSATSHSINTSTQTTALVPTTVVSSLTDADDTEDLRIGVGALGPVDFAITGTSTVQDLVDAINADGTLGTGVANGITASIVDGQIRLRANNPNETITVTDNTVAAGNGLATALGMSSGVAYQPPTYPAVGTNTYPSGGFSDVPNTEGWWNLRIVNLGTGAIEDSGYLNFKSDGSLNALADAEGERKIELENINWGNGSDFQDIDINIGSFSQFAGEYNVAFSNQNGAELGLRTGVEIDREGVVIARFSNGQTANLYKLPLSSFTAPNSLAEESGNVYSETSESGSFNLREAGQGGAGLIQGSTLEASNVDLADEFSKMIITQRAYSAGTKVISTADEMTEELLRLR
jgi:flagellar hook protein FlgE